MVEPAPDGRLMATWRQAGPNAVPPDLAAYNPEIHGPGPEGVRAWSVAARAWLTEDWRRRLPCGDLLDVYRITVALLTGQAPPAATPDGPGKLEIEW
jgi:hypothetical protein